MESRKTVGDPVQVRAIAGGLNTDQQWENAKGRCQKNHQNTGPAVQMVTCEFEGCHDKQAKLKRNSEGANVFGDHLFTLKCCIVCSTDQFSQQKDGQSPKQEPKWPR